MRFHRSTLIPLFMCFTLAFMVACKKDESDAIRPTAKDRPTGSAKADIRLGNGYLEFKTPQVFEQTLQSLTNKTKEEVTAWEKQYGFTSMRTLYEQALQAEMNAVVSNEAGHSDFVMAHKNMLLLHEDGTLDMNNFHNDAAALVNQDGIVKVAGHFYQYTQAYFKVLKGGDEAKLDLLKQATASNESAGITVTKVTVEYPDRAKSGRTTAQTLSEDCWSARTGDHQLKGEIRLSFFRTPIYGDPVYAGEDCYYDEYGYYTCQPYYTYPIIGYNNRERFTLKSFGGRWRNPLFGPIRFDSFTWYEKFISVFYKVDSGTEYYKWARSINTVDLVLTVYDGPGTNISARTYFYGRSTNVTYPEYSCSRDFD